MPMILERAPDTDAVVVALRGCNNEISYHSLASQTGLSVTRMKQVLPSARRVVRSEGALFGVIRGEGLRRLSNIDITLKAETLKKRVFRAVGREQVDQSKVNIAELPKPLQHMHTINRTVLHVMRQQASVKVVEPKEKMTPQPMPNVTQLIQGKKG